MCFPPNGLRTAGGGKEVREKKQVKAGCQHVKLQLLISNAGECISTAFGCIIKEILFATTGGRWAGSSDRTEAVSGCDKSYWQLFV